MGKVINLFGKAERVEREKDFFQYILDYKCILVPVKYAEESRFDNYYIIAKIDSIRLKFDVADYIRVERGLPMYEAEWDIDFDIDELNASIKEPKGERLFYRYRFLHKQYAKYVELLKFSKLEVIEPMLCNYGQFPSALEIKLLNGKKMLLRPDKPNEFGLILALDEGEEQLLLSTLDRFCVSKYQYDPVIYTLSIETNQYAALRGFALNETLSVTNLNHRDCIDYIYAIDEEATEKLRKLM